MSPDEYLKCDATALAALIRSGDVSKGEVLKAAHDRIAVCNPTINAVIDLYDAPVENPDCAGAFRRRAVSAEGYWRRDCRQAHQLCQPRLRRCAATDPRR